MNIIVRTASGRVHVRPDNTLDRYSRDFYVPDGIGTVSLAPVVFARITRPGKCVGRKFAARYFEGCGAGVLLYPEELAAEGPEGFADAIRLDQSSSLPDLSVGLPCTSGPASDGSADYFSVSAGETPVFYGQADSASLLAGAIAEVSVLTLVRTGDLVAVELAPRTPVWHRGEGDIAVRAAIGEKEVLDFSLI